MRFDNIAVCEADHTESWDEEGEGNGSESSTVFGAEFLQFMKAKNTGNYCQPERTATRCGSW